MPTNLSRCDHHVITPTYATFIPHLNQICSMTSKSLVKTQQRVTFSAVRTISAKVQKLSITLRLIAASSKLGSY